MPGQEPELSALGQRIEDFRQYGEAFSPIEAVSSLSDPDSWQWVATYGDRTLGFLTARQTVQRPATGASTWEVSVRVCQLGVHRACPPAFALRPLGQALEARLLVSRATTLTVPLDARTSPLNPSCWG